MARAELGTAGMQGLSHPRVSNVACTALPSPVGKPETRIIVAAAPERRATGQGRACRDQRVGAGTHTTQQAMQHRLCACGQQAGGDAEKVGW
jgi:hypothetical protein